MEVDGCVDCFSSLFVTLGLTLIAIRVPLSKVISASASLQFLQCLYVFYVLICWQLGIHEHPHQSRTTPWLQAGRNNSNLSKYMNYVECQTWVDLRVFFSTFLVYFGLSRCVLMLTSWERVDAESTQSVAGPFIVPRGEHGVSGAFDLCTCGKYEELRRKARAFLRVLASECTCIGRIGHMGRIGGIGRNCIFCIHLHWARVWKSKNLNGLGLWLHRSV